MDMVETSGGLELSGERLDAALDRMLERAGRLEALRRKELLTAEEVQELFGLNALTLKRQRVTGDGPPYVKLPGRVLYRPADVRSYLSALLVRTRDA